MGSEMPNNKAFIVALLRFFTLFLFYLRYTLELNYHLRLQCQIQRGVEQSGSSSGS
jgi:hypothetical protein